MSVLVTVLVIEAEDLAQKELADAVLSAGGLPLCAADAVQARVLLDAGLRLGLVLLDGRRPGAELSELAACVARDLRGVGAALLMIGALEGDLPPSEAFSMVTLRDLPLLIAATELADERAPH